MVIIKRLLPFGRIKGNTKQNAMKTYPKQITAKYYDHDINGNMIANSIIRLNQVCYFTEQVVVSDFDEEEKFYQSLPEGNYVRVSAIQI